jgi:3-mercaptopyruvate sulfurtransferase SseA
MTGKGSPFRARLGPLGVMAIGLVLIFAAVLFGRALRAPSEATAAPTPASPAGMPRVSLADAKAAYDDGTAVFLDVRFADDYAASHIPGALSIPLADLESRLSELNPTDWIITYCT